VLACHTLQKIFNFGLNSHIVFFLVITLSVGVFHGLLDIILLQGKPFQHKHFLLIYGALAIVACALTAQFFGAALIILLLLSVWHFGEQQGKIEGTSQSKQAILRRIVLGTSPLAATFLLGGSDITVILTTLLSESAWLTITWQFWQWLSYLWLLLFAVYLLLLINKQRQHFFNADLAEVQDLAEIAVVWFAFLLLPPLVAFSLYFGAYHALRHIRDVQRNVLPNINAIKKHQKALLLTALASACMLGCVLWLFSSNSMQIMPNLSTQNLLQATIVLLVAITLPHAILISLWRNSLHDKSL
jgi:beta-carotene 15,15'-dioxygenase